MKKSVLCILQRADFHYEKKTTAAEKSPRRLKDQGFCSS